MLKTKLQQLKNAEDELSAVKKRIEDIKASIISEVCPYKVGDVVPIKGYSFSGKPGRITKISLGADYRGELNLHVCASVLKKDGSDSTNTSSWYESAVLALKASADTETDDDVFGSWGGYDYH